MTEISIIRNSEDHPLLCHTPKPGGAIEGLRFLDVLYDNWRGAPRGPAQGALGNQGEAITLSTQRATRSLRVFAWLLEPVFLPLIYFVFRSSKSL